MLSKFCCIYNAFFTGLHNHKTSNSLNIVLYKYIGTIYIGLVYEHQDKRYKHHTLDINLYSKYIKCD